MRPDLALALAVGASVVLYALAAQLSFGRPPWPPFLRQAGRFFYYIGLPYVVLRLGFGQARMMGLADLSGPGDTAIAVGLGGAAFAALAFGWRGYARAIRELPALSDIRQPPVDEHWADIVLQAMYLEAHWAFYRSGFILWLGADYYSGSGLGVLAVIFESLLDPAVRAAFRRRDVAIMDVLVHWSLALVMTVGFFFSRSLWLLAPVHCLVALGLVQVQRAALAPSRVIENGLPEPAEPTSV